MLESSLDPILHQSTLQTLAPETTETPLFSTLVGLCQEPAHQPTPYKQQRQQEQNWPLICALLDGIFHNDPTQLEHAIAQVTHHTTTWDALHKKAPQRWLNKVMEGEQLPMMSVVMHIDLRQHNLSLKQLQYLLQHKHLDHVKILRIDEARLSSLAGILLAQSPMLQQLQELYLGYNPELDEMGSAQLFQHGDFSNMQVLSLAGTRFGDESMKQLVGNTTIRQLKHLYLNENTITDRGVNMLSLASNLSTLETLYLYKNEGISEKSAVMLQQRRELGFPSLEVADLSECNVPHTLCQKLAAPPQQNTSKPNFA